MNLVDTHNHILPGIDDGAKNFEESLRMCQIAVDEGIKTIVATPHYITGEFAPPSFKVIDLVSKLNRELDKMNLDLTVVPGHEVYVDPNIPKLLMEKQICSLNNSKYVLVELPMFGIPNYMEDLIYSIKLKGYTPIIAHPERNTEVIDNPNILFRFIELGALSQLTTWSIMGLYGKKVHEAAELLLEHNMYHLLATDAHSSRNRRPKMEKAIKAVQGTIGVENTDILLNNAQCVINNEDVMLLKPRMVEKSKGLMAFIKKIL